MVQKIAQTAKMESPLCQVLRNAATRIPQASDRWTSQPEEMTTRLGIIQEIIQTEESFNNVLRIFVRLYILPLRSQNSRTWIAGVPTEVATLFDWYEDIANIHHKVLGHMRDYQATRTEPQDRFAERISQMIAGLEVYQPYIVRLADVAHKIGTMVQDPESDFGEFVRLQQSSKRKGGHNVELLLLEPIDRLAQYPLLFKVRQLPEFLRSNLGLPAAARSDTKVPP